MSIRPVELNGMLQRTQDVSSVKQNEDNKPMLQQQNLNAQFSKETVHHMKQVTHGENAENTKKRYDAKEKGDNEYGGSSKQKKKEKEHQKEGKGIPKTRLGGFDIKV